jgi:hypothetical protein
VVIKPRKCQARLLARLLPYPCQIRSHCVPTLCIVPVFLLSRLTYRGDLRSAGISRLFARPLWLSGPHHSRRGHLLPSFHIGQDTRVLPLRLIPQGLLVRRSPGYLPAVVQLDAVFDPGVSALCSSLSHSPHGLRLFGGDRPIPKITFSRGYVSDSGLHPSPRCSRLSFFPACAFSHYTTGRLTNLTQEAYALNAFPSRQATIVREKQPFPLCGLRDLCVRHPLRLHGETGFERDAHRSKRPMESTPLYRNST